MTKYYLHGGYATVLSDENRKFYTEVLSSIDKDDINILIIPFARDVSVWETKLLEIQNRFNEVCNRKTIIIHLAHREVDILIRELHGADIVFLWGGDTSALQKVLEQIPDIQNIFRGKTVAGSSAGALVFSEYYYENDTGSYHTGLGLIESGMICHWKNQYTQKEEIEKVVGGGEVLCIPEGYYMLKEG